MAKKHIIQEETRPKIRPAMTEEGRENQLIALATDLVEKRLRNGTATSQETTHFLKLGSAKNRLELEKLKKENELLEAKTEALRSAKRTEELFAKAIQAFGEYSGKSVGTSDEEDEDQDLNPYADF